MSTREPLHVQVAFAPGPGRAWLRNVIVPDGAGVGEAIDASGLRQAFPDLDADAAHVGIFGRRVPLEHPLRDGDRVEVYRDLEVDPMEARRRRARHSD